MNGYTVFFTYMLSNSGATGFGYTDAIHCNYINSTQLDTVINKEVGLHFDNIDEFKYLTTGNTSGTGYTANQIFVIAQLINNSTYNNISEVKPVSNNWRKFNVTNQIRNRVSGSTDNISAYDLVSSIFKINMSEYNQAPIYDLNYLTMPTILENSSSTLKFGDEEYFLGNVSSDIEAIAYTTDLAINLPLNEFNSTTNATWDGLSSVHITEVAIYDQNKNLVAIGKLNNSVPKNSNTSRTISFAIDF
jgi:hypothetical protein